MGAARPPDDPNLNWGPSGFIIATQKYQVLGKAWTQTSAGESTHPSFQRSWSRSSGVEQRARDIGNPDSSLILAIEDT